MGRGLRTRGFRGCKMLGYRQVFSPREPIMSPADLERYRRRLLDKRRELLSTPAVAHALVPAAGGWEGDVIDQANADAEAELQIRLHRTDGRLARAIEVALVRIRKRTYGVCEACGHPISKVRLNAVPWARLCRECKEREHSAA